MPANKVFLDASYIIALSSLTDQYHKQAEILADKLENEGTQLITTRAIILEIGNALAKQRYRNAAIELLNSLETDPNVKIISLSEELYKRAFQFYQNGKRMGIN